MTFSRTNRIDRRRRVMLEAVASDADYAVEAVRAKKRARARELENHSEELGFTSAYRDPGYSRAVRQTCQKRMVQLIPVRRGTLTIVLACTWILWCGLLVSHYWIHVRIPLTSSNATSSNTGIASLPVSQLFHLRSSHSIAHWLTCQLWMLTALAAWMIFRLRQHKLDDYRAKYRIWAVLAIVALFSSFDASSSGLYLLGISIDGWARKEIGYGGWPLVMATFASLVGVLGIRLCSELKSAPTSVAFWLLGLLSWAISSLLGTGLIKTTWSQSNIDLVVGGCWLGGTLAVFQAAGIYLRQTYIQAQKRFLQRQGANLNPIQWKMPTISLKRTRSEKDFEETDSSDDESTDVAESRKWKLTWPRRGKKSMDAMDASAQGTQIMSSQVNTQQTRNAKPSSSNVRTNEKNMDKGPDKSAINAAQAEQGDEEFGSTKKPPGRLFGIFPHRLERNERIEGEPIREDDGPIMDSGLTKKKGWFGMGGNRNAEEPQTQSIKRKADANGSKKTDPDDPSSIESSADTTSTKGWLRSRKRTASPQPKAELTSDSEAAKVKRTWIPKFGKKTISNDTDPVPATKSAKAPTKTPKKADAKSASSDTTTEETGKRPWMAFPSLRPKLFGMLDGLKLKPPAEQTVSEVSSNSGKPVPIQQGQVLPSTRSVENDEEDSDDNYGDRPMSKAERKKQRRTQQDDRRSA